MIFNSDLFTITGKTVNSFFAGGDSFFAGGDSFFAGGDSLVAGGDSLVAGGNPLYIYNCRLPLYASWTSKDCVDNNLLI